MAAFDKEKSEELSRLYAGHDSSPKGSIDLPCLDLVNFINEELVDYVTTSSCSGRISVYRDKTDECKGVHWLLVKHGYLAKDLFLSCLTAAAAGREEGQVASSMTLKCEGMILHCKCRDVAAAARLHQVSIAAGYREGGITVGKHHVMLAIRTTAYTLESPLIAAGMHLPLPFLEMLLDQANRRMIQNTLRLGKFLRMLKEFFGFPVLFPISPGPGSGIKRIGLAAAHLAGQVLCFGGQGSSGRSQTATLYGEDIRSHCQIDGQATAPVHGVMLKLPCKVFGHIVIISGGRCSPKDSLPCLALYRYIESDLTGKSELEPVTFDETGVAPARRWGHSLIHLEHYSNGREKGLGDVDSEEAVYMLHGGRDLHQVYSDSHLLTVRVGTNGSITAAWHRLQLRNGEGIGALVPSSVLLSDDDDGDFVAEMDADGEEPQPRFFHACALLPNAFDSSSPLVMLHGGLHKLQSGSNNYSSSSLFVVVNPKCRTWSRVACISPRRFAHGLVEVGYGTYLVVGGVYNGDSESVEHGGPEERKGLAKLEVLWHEERGWVGEESAIKIVMSSGRQKGNQEPQQFPCYDCRCHFQALMVPTAPVHSRKLSLLLLGGGASAGFGMHFCQDVRIMVGSIQDELMRSIPIPFQELVPSCPGTVGHIPQTSDNLSSMMALVVCSTSAHRVKMHLESNGWLNKTKRVGNYAFAKAGAEDQHINIQIDKALLECLQIESNQPAVDVDCPGELRDFGKSAEMLKAIPVTPAFLHAFVSCEESLSSSAVSGLYRAMFSHRKPTDATMTLHLTPQKNSHGSRPSHSALLALQRQGRLKVTHAILRQIVHLCCGATDFGNDAIENNEKAGTKFEIVGGSGGAVMVPEGLVQALVDEAIHGGAPAHAGEIEEAALEQLWRDFLANFAGRDTHPMRKPTRVAYKQRIALGPRRESQIRLLYPLPKGDPEELELMFSPLPPLAHLPRFLRGWRPKKTGPGAPGWTHLIENEIVFEWDITRVMFCSGNVTERMRAGARHLPIPPPPSTVHVVVDLYAGIGYYTVPLLVGNKACVVHACEWNDDSVLALERNLEMNGVKERCRIWHGDNVAAFDASAVPGKVSPCEPLLAPYLDSIADSVSLGLLPSSRSGWALAARALKHEGGQIWLHENVRDTPADIRAFVCEAEKFLSSELAVWGKPMRVVCAHIEVVKKYAPRVVHVVLDMVDDLSELCWATSSAVANNNQLKRKHHGDYSQPGRLLTN